jgi:hypothetical protein
VPIDKKKDPLESVPAVNFVKEGSLKITQKSARARDGCLLL